MGLNEFKGVNLDKYSAKDLKYATEIFEELIIKAGKKGKNIDPEIIPAAFSTACMRIGVYSMDSMGVERYGIESLVNLLIDELVDNK